MLRFLDDPCSVIDPTGLNSSTEAIVGHVLQVVHANPRYDFELLEAIPGGMAQMEMQTEAILARVHPRTHSILAIVEDPTYHARLLDYIRAYRHDRQIPNMVRENIAQDGPFAAVERTFGTLPSAMRYFCAMPRTLRGALAHVLRTKTFPAHLSRP